MPPENPPNKTRKLNFYAWTGDPKKAYEMVLDLAFQFACHEDFPKPWRNAQLTPDLAMRELERVVAHWAFGEDTIPGVPPEMVRASLGFDLTGLGGVSVRSTELLERMSQVPKDQFYWDAYHYAVNLYRETYWGRPKRGRPKKITDHVVQQVADLAAQGKSRAQVAIELGREGWFDEIKHLPGWPSKAADRIRHWTEKKRAR